VLDRSIMPFEVAIAGGAIAFGRAATGTNGVT
jgi:hypothetical protein